MFCVILLSKKGGAVMIYETIGKNIKLFRKEFKREDFYKYHPNGALGEMLRKEKQTV